MENLRKRDNREADDDEENEKEDSTHLRASDEILKTRKIRKPNYRKGMDSSINKTEAETEEKTSNSTDVNTKGASFSDLDKEFDFCSKRNEKSETFLETLAKQSENKVPNVDKKEEEAREDTQDTNFKPFNMHKAQDSTNPFANILKQSNLSLFKAADTLSSPWNSGVSFASAAMRSSGETAKASEQKEAEDKLEEEEPGDETNELSVTEDEIIVARCHVKAFRLDTTNKAWKELGPGILKLTVHKDLHDNTKKVTPEANFGRVLFHDARNRINRMNFPLGKSLKVSHGNHGKNLTFSTTVSSTDEQDAPGECQTYLVKESAAGPTESSTRKGMEEYRKLLEKYNAQIVQNSESEESESEESVSAEPIDG